MADDTEMLCSYFAVDTLIIKIPIVSYKVFMHDLYSMTVLINVYRTGLLFP
jgi:hypothetical protein